MSRAAALDALGDLTRRAILELLRAGPRSVQQLADDLPVSRPAVSQHLRVLANARLAQGRARGTRRIYALDPDGFAEARTRLDAFWADALEALRRAAEDEQG